LPVENGSADEEANKRRKLLQEALELDKDDDDEGDDDAVEGGNLKEGGGKDKDAVEEGDMCGYLSTLPTLYIYSCSVMNRRRRHC
jgi:hypothetical protein